MRPLALLFTVLALPLAAGCTATSADEATGTSESAAEAFAHELWAGGVSYTMERYSADPCNNGASRLDNHPIGYGSWERQRAGVRNICFEVWKPGVTDRENNDYWRLLDVQVHYRFKGQPDWKTAYVPSIDRRGNNRRYAWSLGYDLDPVAGMNVADTKAPFEIVNEAAKSVLVRSELEFYFTVNGEYLSTSTNQNFQVHYSGTLEKPALEPLPGGIAKGVLHPEATCTGLEMGGGAGYNAVDITDQAAIDTLLAGNVIHASRMSLTGSGSSRVLTLLFSGAAHVAPGELPRYQQGWGSALRAETHDAGGGKLAVTVKVYDRDTKKLEDRSVTLGSCALN